MAVTIKAIFEENKVKANEELVKAKRLIPAMEAIHVTKVEELASVNAIEENLGNLNKTIKDPTGLLENWFISRASQLKHGLLSLSIMFQDSTISSWEETPCTSKGDFLEAPNEEPDEVDRFLEKEKRHAEPNEDNLITINLWDVDDPRELKIGYTFSLKEHESMTQLLKEFVDIFVWSYSDMPRIYTEIVMHEIQTIPGCKPIKQKQRKLRLK